MSQGLTLTECAERLGVHYMTVYRYVRLGRLAATKVGSQWRVAEDDLEALISGPPAGDIGADWSGRLTARLLAGDEASVRGVVDAALASGMEPSAVYTRMLVPALRDIGERWHDGSIGIGEEHRASVIASRIVGRLGPRFARRGRSRGRVVIGTPPGERHGLPVSIAADLLRGAGWDVVDLGSDLPIEDFVAAVVDASPVTAVAVTISTEAVRDHAVELVAALQEAGLGPVIVGGAGGSSEWAADAAAHAWGRSAEDAVRILDELAVGVEAPGREREN